MRSPRDFYGTAIYSQLDKILDEFNIVREFTHPGEKGREVEGILRNFLKSMLPKTLDVGTGFIVNQSDNSRQTDIIIYNSHRVPPVYSGYELTVIPVHSLLCSIETKMVLTSGQIEKCQNDAAIIKNLHRNNTDAYRSKNDMVISEPLCILFSYESQSFKNIIKKLNENDTKEIDIICSLDGGLSFLGNEKGVKSYSLTCEEHLEFYGKTVFGRDITLKHRFFLFFYSILLDRLNIFNGCTPNYMAWQNRVVVNTEFEK